jgi:hypothetical protein
VDSRVRQGKRDERDQRGNPGRGSPLPLVGYAVASREPPLPADRSTYMPASFTTYAIALTATAVCLGYLVHTYERNRTASFVLINLLVLAAILAIVSKIPWTE